MNLFTEEVIISQDMVSQDQDLLFQDPDLSFRVIEGPHITRQDSPIVQPTGQEEEDGTKIITTIVELTMKYITIVSITMEDGLITEEEEVQVNNTTEDPITDTVEEKEITIRQTLAIQVPTVKSPLLKVLEDFQTVTSQKNQCRNLKKKVQLIKKLTYHKNLQLLQ